MNVSWTLKQRCVHSGMNYVKIKLKLVNFFHFPGFPEMFIQLTAWTIPSRHWSWTSIFQHSRSLSNQWDLLEWISTTRGCWSQTNAWTNQTFSITRFFCEGKILMVKISNVCVSNWKTLLTPFTTSNGPANHSI